MTGPLSRRAFLRQVGVGAGALGLGSLLAACGRGPAPGSTFGAEPAGILNFANWPLYIDKAKLPDGRSVRPSLETFTAETGIQVNYREVIQESDWFFQRIEPTLAAGRPTGWDLIVITNGITLTKLIELGYLVALPADRRPNFDAHAGEVVRDPVYDPGNRYTMAWQSGVTGIAFDPEATGRPITSVRDLFSSEFAGAVGMFGDIVDMPNLALLAVGVAPEDSTPEDWTAAARLLRRQRNDGIVRDYYQQNYVAALGRGDLALTMAWSGDIFAAKISGKIPSRIEFVVPEDGALLWTDNMCIPQGAEHLSDAIRYMDFVYRPAIAAQIAQYVNYITPVPEARSIIQRMADRAEDPAEAQRLREVADSPLVFPTEQDIARLHTYRELPSDEAASEWDAAFRRVYQS